MIDFAVPCLFGLEGPLAEELRRLGAHDVRSDNGRVSFTGDERDIARYNISLRCAERLLIELGSFSARTFDELFEGTKALEWERFIPRDGRFPVKGHSLNSQLHSVPDCQSIIKKAVAERLGAAYKLEWLPEEGALYQIQFSLMGDRATLYLDTSGVGLHKRGYRPQSVAAPLRETLAAGIVLLTRYWGRERFYDPFCGSGTIPIEAALIAMNRAPGLLRKFSAELWTTLPAGLWPEAREEARSAEYSGSYDITGSDIDPEAVELARQNAERAEVSQIVKFAQADALQFTVQTERGIIAANPPYGERLMDRESAETLYQGFGEALRKLSGWQYYILSAHPEFERHFGGRADKKRKLYNGMIKCDLYIYNREKARQANTAGK